MTTENKSIPTQPSFRHHFACVAMTISCLTLAGCAEQPVGHVLTYQVVPRINANASNQPIENTSVSGAINRRLGQDGRAILLPNGEIEVSIYGGRTQE